ncbi:unnamed protein product [Rangifer tarandus platyrhynchus]|uniref:Uncharacterized protein n=1 Tax=Rangifer tarandus platyrhynchus TaxID=3082113 RepID=A0AC60A1V4_RANTA
MSQGKLNVLKEEMARVNINILGISELKRKKKTATIKISERKGSLACYSAAQFNSVAQSCPTLCDPMDYSTPGFLVHHQNLLGAFSNSRSLSQRYHPTISSSVIPFSSRLQSFPASGSFQ